MRSCFIGIVVLVSISTIMPTYAQDMARLETIPQRLARVGQSLTSQPTIPSGTASVADLLREAELIVRGTIGSPTKAYLSKDETQIYTDYPLINPIVFYSSRPQSSGTPGPAPAIAVTVFGGSVQIGGLTYTLEPKALPKLPVGSEGLFLLRRIDEKYQPVGRFLGALEISNNRIAAPFTRKLLVGADEYRGAEVSKTAQAWASTVAKRGQGQR
jgi:hypothetical protein